MMNLDLVRGQKYRTLVCAYPYCILPLSSIIPDFYLIQLCCIVLLYSRNCIVLTLGHVFLVLQHTMAYLILMKLSTVIYVTGFILIRVTMC